MKRCVLLILLFCVFSYSFACSNALPTNDANFCSSFKSVATCYCTSSGLPSGMCQDVSALYGRMVIVFGSLQKACEYQKHTNTQNCLDNWNCYMYGGSDSQGNLCSSSGSSCR